MRITGKFLLYRLLSSYLYVMMLLLASPFRRKKRPCWTAGFLEHLVLAHMRTYVYCFGQKKSGKIVGNDEYT